MDNKLLNSFARSDLAYSINMYLTRYNKHTIHWVVLYRWNLFVMQKRPCEN